MRRGSAASAALAGRTWAFEAAPAPASAAASKSGSASPPVERSIAAESRAAPRRVATNRGHRPPPRRYPPMMQTLAALPATLGRTASIVAAVAIVTTILAFALSGLGASHTIVFIVSAVALAGLAVLIGQGTDELGQRFGPATTGILQSALGNLPELFISIFALRAGLVVVVQTALIGSILANTLLVLGLAFLVGGLRHGTQTFHAPSVRTMATLLLLAVAALPIPAPATAPREPGAGHEIDLSGILSSVPLGAFSGSIPF